MSASSHVEAELCDKHKSRVYLVGGGSCYWGHSVTNGVTNTKILDSEGRGCWKRFLVHVPI